MHAQNQIVLTATEWCLCSSSSILGQLFELLTHVPGNAGPMAPTGPLACFSPHCCFCWACMLPLPWVLLSSTWHHCLSLGTVPPPMLGTFIWHQKYVLCSTSCHTEDQSSATCVTVCPRLQNNSSFPILAYGSCFPPLCLLLDLCVKMNR